jgi:hypothetical protein
MRWAPWTALAPMAFLLLAGCETPLPPNVNPAAYQQALLDCKQQARVYGYRNWGDFDDIGRPRIFARDTSWEYIDPCMQARGFPPPP